VRLDLATAGLHVTPTEPLTDMTEADRTDAEAVVRY
jgi:hypothetical protein